MLVLGVRRIESEETDLMSELRRFFLVVPLRVIDSSNWILGKAVGFGKR